MDKIGHSFYPCYNFLRGNFMKKPLLPAILLLTLGVGAVWAVLFYRANLRGFAPAVFKVSSDAAALVRQDNSPLSYPAEFKLSVFMDGLPGCRVITFDAQDTMLVSIPSQGKGSCSS